jgi:iron complex transport system substrate-binding protein
MRICSFLPSATEILYALGLGDSIHGVTYECDFPDEARRKPVVVNTRLSPSASTGEIDRQVRDCLARGESLYRIEADMLRKIQPDLIVTQDLCRVCAASPGDLASTLAAIAQDPKVLSLNPVSLEDVWDDIVSVGVATERDESAARFVREIKRRISAIEGSVSSVSARPRVLCLEWLDPPFVGGHWVPEMVARAGGVDVLGRPGEPGYGVDWERVLAARPEVVVVMPCGYHLKETVEQFRSMRLPQGWKELPAAVNGRVFAVDGSSYFSRPGPRLVDGVEILAHLLHPDHVSRPALDEAFAPLT